MQESLLLADILLYFANIWIKCINKTKKNRNYRFCESAWFKTKIKFSVFRIDEFACVNVCNDENEHSAQYVD